MSQVHVVERGACHAGCRHEDVRGLERLAALCRQQSRSDELALLLVHGILHILGHDHAEPAEEAAMRALERTILAAG